MKGRTVKTPKESAPIDVVLAAERIKRNPKSLVEELELLLEKGILRGRNQFRAELLDLLGVSNES